MTADLQTQIDADTISVCDDQRQRSTVLVMKIRKGDLVKVMRGVHRGKSGRVEKILTARGQAIVVGINVVKRRRRQNSGGVTEVIKPLPISKLAVICPKCQKTGRLGIKIEANRKVRFCKKCLTPFN